MALSEDFIKNNSRISETDLRKLLSYLDNIQYGSVTLQIQEGRVVQIERSEKIRLK